MRTLFTLAVLFAVLALQAQAPKDLSGSEYRGTSKSEPMEGCEGCGNAGNVEFRSGNEVEFLLPGSDIIEFAKYTRKGEQLKLVGSSGHMELKGDTLFFTMYDHRHVYLRVRD